MRALRRRAKELLGLGSVSEAFTGAVVAIQRTDSALRLNVHLHVLALDGIYVRQPQGALRFHALSTPSSEQVADIARRTAQRLARAFEAQGLPQSLPISRDQRPRPRAGRSGRARWGWLIGHVFLADVEHCVRCGGPMRWVEAATTAEAIARLLAKHGLAPRPPPPARSAPLARGPLSFVFAGSAR